MFKSSKSKASVSEDQKGDQKGGKGKRKSSVKGQDVAAAVSSPTASSSASSEDKSSDSKKPGQQKPVKGDGTGEVNSSPAASPSASSGADKSSPSPSRGSKGGHSFAPDGKKTPTAKDHGSGDGKKTPTPKDHGSGDGRKTPTAKDPGSGDGKKTPTAKDPGNGDEAAGSRTSSPARGGAAGGNKNRPLSARGGKAQGKETTKPGDDGEQQTAATGKASPRPAAAANDKEEPDSTVAKFVPAQPTATTTIGLTARSGKSFTSTKAGVNVPLPDGAEGSAGGKSERKTVDKVKLNIMDNIADLVGNSPMVYLNPIAEGCLAKLAVKVDFLQPARSVKDRICLAMIRDAEAKGTITPGTSTIIEATSGNTAVSLAFVGAALGYKVVIVLPAIVDMDRRTLLAAYGAEVVITDPSKGMPGCMKVAEEIANSTPGSFMVKQFDHPALVRAHFETTGPEIWRDSQGQITHFVCGVGTGGTITGVARFLKQMNKDIKIIAVEPEESAVLSGRKPGLHKILGIGIGVKPPQLDMSLVDEIIPVSTQTALQTARATALEEGLLVGISSGATIAAGVIVAKRPKNKGKLVVAHVASFGERYLASPLFDGIRDEVEKMSFDPVR